MVSDFWIFCGAGDLEAAAKDKVRRRIDGISSIIFLNPPGGVPGAAGARLRKTASSKSKTSLQALHSELNLTKPSDHKVPPVWASSWGDMFKIGKLLELAHIDLDRDFNIDGMSSRMAGTILEVEVIYENLMPFLSSFGQSQVQYTYRIKEKKLPYMSREYLAPVQPAEYPERRTIVYQGGILIVFTVAGQFGFFSIVYLLIMLTTSLALLATAAKVTDVISIYVHPRRRNYFHLKYEVSPDFSDMWECPKCGFFNSPDQETCKGLEKWQSEHDADTDLCGEPRPAGAGASSS